MDRNLSIRLCLASALALIVAVAFAGSASADTTFGGNPNGTATELTCADGTPPPFTVGGGSTSCTWSWLSNSGQSDYVPFGPPGGTGTLNSVTLPAMAHPGPMQVDVLTSTAFINSSGKAEAACCSVKEISPTFTVPANAVTTVPLSLAVSSTPNVYNPGETQKSDVIAISVLDGTSSLPLRYTQSGNDLDRASFPAVMSTTQEIREFTDASEVEVMASFAFGPPAAIAPVTPTPAPTPAPAPAPAPSSPTAPPSPSGGLALIKRPLEATANGKTAVLGKATNPPTAATTQTITGILPVAAGHGRAAASAKPKPVVLGRGRTTVPTGHSAALTAKLTGAARHALARGATLKATEKIVATGPGGTSTTTATVRLKRHSR